MIVVCPFVPDKLRPETRRALTAHAPQAEYVDLSDNDHAYWRLMSRLWAAAESLLIVEEDVEIHAGVIPQLEACPSPWCLFPHELRFPAWITLPDGTAGYIPPERRFVGQFFALQLSCTRFSGELMREHPDIVTGIPEACRHWLGLDSHIGAELTRRGVSGPHVHSPPVPHHHPSDALGNLTTHDAPGAAAGAAAGCQVCRDMKVAEAGNAPKPRMRPWANPSAHRVD